MIFIETKHLNLKVPSKHNLPLWSQWINSPYVRRTILSAKMPKTIDMQWNWIIEALNSKKRILLEICCKADNEFLGIVSLSEINHEIRSGMIGTIAPFSKNKKNRYCVYEARIAILKYAFQELSLNKVYGTMLYPDNKSFLVKNMCVGFEIEGINHDSFWLNNIPFFSVQYFINKSIFEKKKILENDIDIMLSKENRNLNEKKLLDIISYLKF